MAVRSRHEQLEGYVEDDEVVPQESAVQTPIAGTYSSSQGALEELEEAFNYWSGQVSATSLQLCYALIAAIWLIFGSVKGILGSSCATLALFAVLLALATNLISSYAFAEFSRCRFGYAEKDRRRWETEFQAERNKASKWPYTPASERASIILRGVKTFLPLFGGVLLIVAAIRK
jgi:hypothetical protein